jgi:dTDP-4-dehydrorhamnose 3,5-epimerase
MIFQATQLEDAWLIQPECHHDSRGFFARTWCRNDFAALNLDVETAQESISYNRTRGTLRGLHFQLAPHQETKIVRCINGAIWDVIVDLRPESGSYLHWQAFELTAQNMESLYIPKGFAHGFQSLTDHALVSYRISTPYVPSAGHGCRYDDPAFGISWPERITEMSQRDREWADFTRETSAPNAR